MSMFLAAGPLLVACASGAVDPSGSDGRGPSRREAGVPDRWLPSRADAWVWPDQGVIRDSNPLPKADAAPPDLPLAPDFRPQPDSAPPPLSCPDKHEINEACNVSKYLGATKEGGSWPSTTGTLNPGSDVDWYRVRGEEKSHTCLPFTSQKYYLRVRLAVPAGRALRVCLYKETCGGGGICASNTVKTASTQLNVKYKVSGTCALNDDTTAYFKVEATDGKGGCTPYTVAYNYN